MYSCSFPTSQIYLGKHPHERFTEETAKRYMERFHNAMEGIAADILKRNESLDVPYRYLLPERVPNSITI